MILQLKSSQVILVSKLFIITVFIPFISPVPVPASTQPIVTILACLLIFSSKFNSSVHKVMALQLIPVLISLAFFLLSLQFSTLRSFVAYTNCFAVSVASYIVFRNQYLDYDDLKKLLFWISIMWLVFGLLQMVTGRDVTIPFKHYIWGDEVFQGRGYSSLATEPSHYGTICMFILFVLFYTKKLTKFISFLLLFQILFVARSAVTLFYLLLFFLTILISKVSLGGFIKYSILFCSLIALVIIYAKDLNNSNVRLLYLIGKIATTEPQAILLVDHSMNHRFQHVFFSILGAIDNYLLPQSINNWPVYYDSTVSDYQDIIVRSFDSPHRVMSGLGGAFFELGIFGFVYPVQIVAAFNKFADDKKFAIFSSLFFIAIMFSAIPLALPPFGFLLGLLLSKLTDNTESAD